MSRLVTEKDALLASFPYSLTRDEDKGKLADAIAEELIKTIANSEYAAVFLRLDDLPEEVLDILAADLNVEWYDCEGTLEEKRRIIHECMQVHRYKGTKYAVEKALRSVYEDARVAEWFEYGGEPYHFKIIIYDSSNDRDKRDRVIAKVQYYKNLRSVLEETIFEVGVSTDIAVKAAFRPCGIYKKIKCEVKNYG
ncbi:MAG: phage tail protein I [Oscillospiraceae bacterium]